MVGPVGPPMSNLANSVGTSTSEYPNTSSTEQPAQNHTS